MSISSPHCVYLEFVYMPIHVAFLFLFFLFSGGGGGGRVGGGQGLKVVQGW